MFQFKMNYTINAPEMEDFFASIIPGRDHLNAMHLLLKHQHLTKKVCQVDLFRHHNYTHDNTCKKYCPETCIRCINGLVVSMDNCKVCKYIHPDDTFEKYDLFYCLFSHDGTTLLYGKRPECIATLYVEIYIPSASVKYISSGI